MQNKIFDVVIVGGGSAGVTVAARLRKKRPALQIALIEPSVKHYYQPLWTLVGGGVVDFSKTERNEASLIPAGVQWIKDAVTAFDPENNSVQTNSNGGISYKYLVVCPGIQIDWHKVEGLTESLGKNGICSNYSKDTVTKTWDFIRDFKGGTAVFTFPNTPIKCAGAPQKIMYLAEHYFRKQGLRDKCRIIFASAGGKIFGVEKYAQALSKIVQERGIETVFFSNLEKIDSQAKIAYFRNLNDQSVQEIKFDMIHVGPPMSAPDFVKQSALANESGWVDVDKSTLQHNKYKNVFSLGDVSSAPTSKTGAAVRKQSPIVVENLLAVMDQQPLRGKYDGYTSCPLVTGYGKLILAEFNYEGQPVETFPFDQGKERLSMYLLKKHVLPKLYWDAMLKGM